MFVDTILALAASNAIKMRPSGVNYMHTAEPTGNRKRNNNKSTHHQKNYLLYFLITS
jgi:hypothetical protein